MDQHTWDGDPPKPWNCPEGRSILYVGKNLTASAGEVFGEAGHALICPLLRVAILKPRTPIPVLDVCCEGCAMSIGALPSIAVGSYERRKTWEWAKAIYEDQPVPDQKVFGIYYTAAYSGGRSLALWDRQGQVEVASDELGALQDFALADAPILWRLNRCLSTLKIPWELEFDCSHMSA
ncbi:hypothetical protein ACFU51_07495 [Streptomyces sp. NPDC057430]|uniref:hypothetical protein n=1 Tax=Streptomyces sp. NPDC057430 TaxID=3346131 RepID=UPI00369793A0